MVLELQTLSGWDLYWIWKASCLVQGQQLSFHRAGRIWPRMKGEVGLLNVLNPIPSPCNITTPCHKSHPILTPQMPLGICFAPLFLSAEPHQQTPYNQHELVEGESGPSSSPNQPWGWAGLTAHPVCSCAARGKLLRVTLPLQQDFIYFLYCLALKYKKNTAGKIIISTSVERFLESRLFCLISNPWSEL